MINKHELSFLYNARDINILWEKSQSKPIIKHPEYGLISPNKYRSLFHNKPCPYCGQKMKHGEAFKTNSKSLAIQRNYQYQNKQGNLIINQINQLYFHQHYVTLDHKLNKARFPEKIFDYENLEVICWQCNTEKSDDNTFELQHNMNYLTSLTQETLKRYPLL